MGAYENALKYAQERLQFGKPIGSFPARPGPPLQDACQYYCRAVPAGSPGSIGGRRKMTDSHAALSKAFCTAKCRETWLGPGSYWAETA